MFQMWFFFSLVSSRTKLDEIDEIYVSIEICSDVFPYGIYMLAYEYAVNALASADWVKEKRKQIKEMQNSHIQTVNYIEISIPILAGAFAGKFN